MPPVSRFKPNTNRDFNKQKLHQVKFHGGYALDKEVGIVKLSDRITNLQKPPLYWDNQKKLAYREEAQLIAESLIDKNGFLSKRLQSKIEECQIQMD